jgi:hypothetical protein
MREISNSVAKQYPKKELSIGKLKPNVEPNFPKSRTPSVMEGRRNAVKKKFSKLKRSVLVPVQI